MRLEKFEYIVPLIVSIVLFMEYLDTSIINTAIPDIASEFFIDPLILKFAISSYLLSLTIFIPLSGWVTDKFGTKTVFLSSILIFTLASLGCATSKNLITLTTFRFIQGIGGAFMNPASRIVILKSYPSNQLLKIQSIVFTPALIGTAMGPVLGGVITYYFGWKWIFFINIPIGILVLYLSSQFIEQYTNKVSSFNILSFILSVFALIGITLFVYLFNNKHIVGQYYVYFLGLIGIMSFGILIYYSFKVKNAIFSFSLFNIFTYRVGIFINMVIYALNASIAFLFPIMFQKCFKISVDKSGLLYLPVAIGYIGARFLSLSIINMLGFKRMIIYFLTALVIILFMFANISITSSIVFICIVEFFYGFFFILVGASLGTLLYVDMPKNNVSMATSLDLTSRQFASNLGIGFSSIAIVELSHLFLQGIYDANNLVFRYTFIMLMLFPIIGIITSSLFNKDIGKKAFIN